MHRLRLYPPAKATQIAEGWKGAAANRRRRTESSGVYLTIPRITATAIARVHGTDRQNRVHLGEKPRRPKARCAPLLKDQQLSSTTETPSAMAILSTCSMSCR